MRKKITRLAAFAFAVMFIAMSLATMCLAAEARPMDKSNVKDDLTAMGYDVTKYVRDTSAEHIEVIDFLEYGYSADGKQGNYGLYVYVYNPSGKEIKMNGNSLELSYSCIDGSFTSYLKYSMTLIDVTKDDAYKDVLYKFLVHNSSSIAKFINANQREYRISGIELKYDDSIGAKPIDFAVARTYSYVGYQANYGRNGYEKSTLYKTWKTIDVAEVEMHAASWFSRTSDLGEDYRYEVSSVYFNIPNWIVEKYGDLDKECSGLVEVRGGYTKKATNGLLVPDNSWVGKYDRFCGVDISTNPFGYGYAPDYTLGGDTFCFYHTSKVVDNGQGTNTKFYYDYSYNRFNGSIKYPAYIEYHYTDHFVETIGSVVPCSSFDKFYSNSSNYLNYYNAQGRNSWTNTTYLRSLVSQNVGKLGYQEYVITNSTGSLNSSIKSYASSIEGKNAGFLKKLFHRELFVDANGYAECLPLVEVSKSDFNGSTEEAAERLFVTVDDKISLEKFYEANSKDNHIYIMRLDVNPYFALDVVLSDQTKADNNISSGISGDGVYFEKVIYEDIDIFEFVFEDKGGNRQLVPVVTSPIDNVGSLTTGPTSGLDGGNKNPNDNDGDKDSGLVNRIITIMLIILAVIVVVVFVLIITRIIGKFTVWRGKYLDNKKKADDISYSRSDRKSKKQDNSSGDEK